MRRDLMTGGALALLLAGTTAVSAATWNYEVWDVDNDRMLTETEFTTGARESGVFDTWDADTSGVLDRDEFYGGVYGAWDADDDMFVTEDEFGRTGLGWYEDDEFGSYEAWDTNADARIDENEFRAVAYETDLYEDWGSTDEGLTEDQFYGGLYGTANYGDADMVTLDEDEGWFDWF